MPVFGVAKFERFFRLAAELDVDKDDLKRFSDFVEHKLYDLLLIGQARAKANGRDIIETWDLPITKGLQERMREFARMDEAAELRTWLQGSLRRPPDEVTFGEDTEDTLVEVFGGISVALARSFRLLDEQVKNPTAAHWDRAFEMFRLLV